MAKEELLEFPGTVSELHILEAMDPAAALGHAATAAKAYTPAG